MSPRMHLVGVSMLSVRLVIVCSFSQWLVLRFSFTFTEKMISNAQLQGVPLLVLANKQDLQVRQLYISEVNCENTHWIVATVWLFFKDLSNALLTSWYVWYIKFFGIQNWNLSGRNREVLFPIKKKL